MCNIMQIYFNQLSTHNDHHTSKNIPFNALLFPHSLLR